MGLQLDELLQVEPDELLFERLETAEPRRLWVRRWLGRLGLRLAPRR